jgi:hypothetical protein
MQIKRKFTVILATMIVAGQIGGTPSHAAPSVDQMLMIQEFLDSGNLGALVAFVEANPGMLQEGSLLADGLLNLMTMFQSGVPLGALSLSMVAELEEALRQSMTQYRQASLTASIY